jgi:plastocyanin
MWGGRGFALPVAIAGGCLVLWLAGCGGTTPSNSGGGSGNCGSGTAAVSGLGTPAKTVSATDQLQFSPATATAHVGQVVEWTAGSTMTHTITFQSANASCLSDPQLLPGSTWEVKFTQTGTYDYICTLHPGMNGTVSVSP